MHKLIKEVHSLIVVPDHQGRLFKHVVSKLTQEQIERLKAFNLKQYKQFFIYVQDVAELYMKMAEEIFIRPEKMRGEVFNAGTNKGYNVREILELIFKLCDNKKEFNRILKKMKNKKTTGEINLQIMDHKKIKKYIGWQPRYNLKTGLTETISWFSDYLKKSNL